jgi:hypothetical protein
MENLISACRAYAADLPPQVHGWEMHAAAIAFLIFAIIGFLWSSNKIIELIVWAARPIGD